MDARRQGGRQGLGAKYTQGEKTRAVNTLACRHEHTRTLPLFTYNLYKARASYIRYNLQQAFLYAPFFSGLFFLVNSIFSRRGIRFYDLLFFGVSRKASGHSLFLYPSEHNFHVVLLAFSLSPEGRRATYCVYLNLQYRHLDVASTCLEREIELGRYFVGRLLCLFFCSRGVCVSVVGCVGCVG